MPLYRPFIRIAKLCVSSIFYVLTETSHLLGRKRRGAAVVLCYHAVPKLQRERFAKQMDILRRCATPLRADHVGLLPDTQRFVAVTFDDGHRSVFENAVPELRKRNIPCTVFLITDLLGKAAPWAGIESYEADDRYITAADAHVLGDDLVEFGSHTSTHPRLPRIETQFAISELRDSRAELERILGRRITLFAFPHGDHNDALIEACIKIGYRRVFTVEPTWSFSEPNEYVTGRITTDPKDWEVEFRLKILGAYRWLAFCFAYRDWIRNRFGNPSRVTTTSRTRFTPSYDRPNC